MTFIDTVRARAALKPRKDPHWQVVAKGLAIGLRVMEGAAPTWTIRYRNATGKQVYKPLGNLLEILETKRFDYCHGLALKFMQEQQRRVDTVPGTVAAACAAYVEDRREKKGERAAHDASRRYARLVYAHSIGAMMVADLTARDVEQWRSALVKFAPDASEDKMRRARETANRNMTMLRSALNYVYKHDWAATPRAWAAVEQYENTTGRRTLFLTLEQRRAVVAACADQPELRALVEACLLTGLRVGQVAKMTRGRFDEARGTVEVPKGKTKAAPITLPSAAVKLFAQQCRDKTPAAPIFHAPGGGFWNSSNQWNPLIKRVGKAIGVPTLCAYDFRHAAISAMIEAAIDVYSIAELCQTGIEQIRKHYGHLSPAVREKYDRAAVL